MEGYVSHVFYLIFLKMGLSEIQRFPQLPSYKNMSVNYDAGYFKAYKASANKIKILVSLI